MIVVFAWFGSVLADRGQLNDSLIRFHVIANSDDEKDQALKLQVRDAVLRSIGTEMEKITDMEQARVYLEENLPVIEEIAKTTLSSFGCRDDVDVSLGKESYDTRVYDTFSLPAGVYESLRIVIGDGNGANWWCVAFPALCLPATMEEVSAVAADSGFSESLGAALIGETGYELRFYLLDAIGSLEKFFFRG